MHTVCSHVSKYFSFYDEYWCIHYDDEITIMLDMKHDSCCISKHPAIAK